MRDVASQAKRQLVKNGECLDWPGGRQPNGYGRVWVNGKYLSVHRLICEDAHGAPPQGKLLAIHSCDRRICANPDHLRWGTPAENTTDMMSRGRSNPPKGERSATAKLTELQARLVRRLCDRGAPQTRLARWFGVNQSQISRIANRKTWVEA